MMDSYSVIQNDMVFDFCSDLVEINISNRNLPCQNSASGVQGGEPNFVFLIFQSKLGPNNSSA
jgi:hypothetical protein